MVDKDMRKKDLQKATNIRSVSITKCEKKEIVNIDISVKVCKA